MSTQEEEDKLLSAVLKKYGTVAPAEEFSDQLRDSIVAAYGKPAAISASRPSSPWVARVILVMAIGWLALFIYYFGSFAIQPVFSISMLSFTAGLWALILIIRKSNVTG